jgi:hypothetical protein
MAETRVSCDPPVSFMWPASLRFHIVTFRAIFFNYYDFRILLHINTILYILPADSYTLLTLQCLFYIMVLKFMGEILVRMLVLYMSVGGRF